MALIGDIEKHVPFPKVVGKRNAYGFFDTMDVGDSVLIEGDAARMETFRSALRSRNARYRERDGDNARQFDWDYETIKSMRIWRVK
jgi:hypothetical protein